MSLIRSLRSRLLFLICLATLPAVVFTFFAAENERKVELVRMEKDALHLAGLASREQAHQIEGARALLWWLGEKLERDGMGSPIVTDPAFIKALLAGHPQLANIGVLTPEGEVVASAYPLASYRSWRENPTFLAALKSKGVVAGEYLISPIFEEPTLNHAYAVRSGEGEVLAVLFNGLNLSWLTGLEDQRGMGEGVLVMIVDAKGRVLTKAGDEKGLEMGVQIQNVRALAREGGGKVLEVGGEMRYFVAVQMESAPEIFVAVALPHERITKQTNLAFYRALGILGVLTLFVVVAVFVVAELGILRGLRALAKVAQRFGEGELKVRVRVAKDGSELEALGMALNMMADALEARHREALEAQAKLRALAERLQTTREQEAMRISRELHDEIGQMLTALKIELSRLPSLCGPKERILPCAGDLLVCVGEMGQRVDKAMKFVRRIASELRPVVLDKLGLTAALEWQAREVEVRAELVVQVDADVCDGDFDDRLALTLFRIAQEALNNVVRHAQARFVDVDLTVEGGEVLLNVKDDGVGIEAGEVDGYGSLGLIGMKERAALLGGRVEVYGERGRGTTVRVTIPMNQIKERGDENFVS